MPTRKRTEAAAVAKGYGGQYGRLSVRPYHGVQGFAKSVPICHLWLKLLAHLSGLATLFGGI